MTLVHVAHLKNATGVLYALLRERPSENNISHIGMPSADEHFGFVHDHPFRYWYVIVANGQAIGALECTDRNEVGIAIFRRYHRRGYGAAALRLFMRTHQPLPPIAAVRNGHWLANIACSNIGSKLFFAKLGFRALQETWQSP